MMLNLKITEIRFNCKLFSLIATLQSIDSNWRSQLAEERFHGIDLMTSRNLVSFCFYLSLPIVTRLTMLCLIRFAVARSEL